MYARLLCIDVPVHSCVTPRVCGWQIVTGEGEEALCILPTKFRKMVWVKRGAYEYSILGRLAVACSTGGLLSTHLRL